MQKNKKAVTVDVNLKVRVIVDSDMDLDFDPKFEEIINTAIKDRMFEEGTGFIGQGIDNYEDDKENPFDPEYDDY